MNALKNTCLALAIALAPIALSASPASAQEGAMGSSTLAGTASDAPVTVDPALATSLTGGESGWQPMESLRVELEYLYRSSAGSRLDALAPTDASPDSRSMMANALIDFRFSDWVTPYVGVGVGLARTEPPSSGLREVGRDDVFAYQGIVGVSVPFTDTLSFFADGRYMRSDDFSLGLSSVSSDSHLRSWSATAGIRFTFGGN
ncbi:MAG: putative surface protein (Wolbachia endosymbiont) [Pseudomonadota bacterium]|jgi:opacity protein-like surface antigen